MARRNAFAARAQAKSLDNASNSTSTSATLAQHSSDSSQMTINEEMFKACQGEVHVTREDVKDDSPKTSVLVQVVNNTGTADEAKHDVHQKLKVDRLKFHGGNFLMDTVSSLFRHFHTLPCREVAMFQAYLPGQFAKDFVADFQFHHPHGISGAELNAGDGLTESKTPHVYDDVRIFVMYFDPRVFMEPVTNFSESSFDAESNGNYLKAFQIRWHGRYRFEVYHGAQEAYAGALANPRPLHAAFIYSGGVHGRNMRHVVVESKEVSRGNILNGSDVRTTFMIRGIPPGMQIYEFIAILNRAMYGRIDFLYLRFDFAHAANVGYGFVNVTHPRYILKLMDFFAVNTWPGTTRRGHLTYATIQGTEAMIERFRNSAVMCQPWAFRPHLFYTLEDGELCTVERRWPLPSDNHRVVTLGRKYLIKLRYRRARNRVTTTVRGVKDTLHRCSCF